MILDKIAEINGSINGVVWGIFGLALLVGTGIIVTCCTKFFQVTKLGLWWKNTIGNMFSKEVLKHRKEKGTISPFQALCTALAATVGTGNIAGVAAAICIGGAGAVFWMWVAAFFGMMTNYAENTLGIYFRRKNSKGEWSGGAMYYLQDGLGGYKYEDKNSKASFKNLGKILAVLFCIFAMLASFGIGSMGQVNKIVANVADAFKVESLANIQVFDGISLYNVIIGVVVMILTAIITLGGVKRIANVAEKIVPFMVVLFVAGSLVIIGINYDAILPAFKAIFVNAFKTESFVGGGIGGVIIAITNGFKRGVFSNEAGLGSSVMVHSNSSIKEPVKQGMWGIFEVFADTMIVCTMTALVVLTSGGLEGGVFNVKTGEIAAGLTDATLVGGAFDTVFPGFGKGFIAVAMFLFAFTTILGWSHYGSKAWEYLFGAKTTFIFRIIHVCTIIFGAVLTSSLAWDISDTFNGLMMIPNLIGVLFMLPLVVKITKNYVDRKVKKKDVKPILSYDENIQAEAEEAILNGEE
ncbi:MAG: sodium:alanine symporter family protein [Clostridia bacterium]|nr:sodium:alanine symporter family protein [Clostridia bacterium]MBR4116452.1 sodium:alanine symporter family protein [Clostridia bacterium]